MNMVQKALEIAIKAHKGQIDKAGKEYILHPIMVALMVCTNEEKQVALLHDVIEDTKISIEDLRKEGFNGKILDAITAITKNKNENYDQYLDRVIKNNIATNVKLADMHHNSDINRYENPTIEDKKRSESYFLKTKKLLLKIEKNKNK